MGVDLKGRRISLKRCIPYIDLGKRRQEHDNKQHTQKDDHLPAIDCPVLHGFEHRLTIPKTQLLKSVTALITTGLGAQPTLETSQKPLFESSLRIQWCNPVTIVMGAAALT